MVKEIEEILQDIEQRIEEKGLCDKANNLLIEEAKKDGNL